MEFKQLKGGHFKSVCGDYDVFDDLPLGWDPAYRGKNLISWGVSCHEAHKICEEHKAGNLDIEKYKPYWLIEREEKREEQEALSKLTACRQLYLKVRFGKLAGKKARGL